LFKSLVAVTDRLGYHYVRLVGQYCATHCYPSLYCVWLCRGQENEAYFNWS